MARPEKLGLDYFPLDVDIFESDKMLAISGEFAVKGEIITLRLLCEIYRNGYFVEYSELLKNKLARLSGLSVNLIDEVVGKLVKYGFFDESIFREHAVLTSKGIQKRYLEAVKRRKNVLCEHYWLLNGVNVNINPASKGVNVNISTQSKVKESKVKERRESDTPTHEVVSDSTATRPEWHLFPIDGLLIELMKSQAWKDSVGMQYRLPPNEIDPWLTRFAGHLKASGEETKTLRDGRKHFSSWLRIQLEKRVNESGVSEDPAMSDPTAPPDGSGKWKFINGKWRDTSKFTNAQKRRNGLL